jgi:hypothetical protein
MTRWGGSYSIFPFASYFSLVSCIWVRTEAYHCGAPYGTPLVLAEAVLELKNDVKTFLRYFIRRSSKLQCFSLSAYKILV